MIVFVGDELKDQSKTEEVVGGDTQTPRDVEMTNIPDSINLDEIPGEEGAPLLSMVTRSRKRKFLDYDDMISASSSPLSEVSKNLEGEVCDENPDSRFEVRSVKRPNLSDHATLDSVVESKEICDVIVYDLVNDLISKVSGNAEVGINGVDDDGYNRTSVTQNDVMEVTSSGVDVENTIVHPEVSGDSREQQLIVTDDKYNDAKGNKSDVTNIIDRRSNSTFPDKISNGIFSDTNGIPKGREEQKQNHDASEPVLNCALNQCVGTIELKLKTGVDTVEMQTSVDSSSHCPETQEINGSITCVKGADVYINGQHYETKNDVCNGDHPSATRKSACNLSTKEEPTRMIPTENEPTALKSTESAHSVNGHTGMIPSPNVPAEIIPTVKESAGIILTQTESSEIAPTVIGDTKNQPTGNEPALIEMTGM